MNNDGFYDFYQLKKLLLDIKETKADKLNFPAAIYCLLEQIEKINRRRWWHIFFRPKI